MRLVVVRLDDIRLEFGRDFPNLREDAKVKTKSLADDVQVNAGSTYGVGEYLIVRSRVPLEGGYRYLHSGLHAIRRTQPVTEADEVLGRAGDRVGFHHREYPQGRRCVHTDGDLVRLRGWRAVYTASCGETANSR